MNAQVIEIGIKRRTQRALAWALVYVVGVVGAFYYVYTAQQSNGVSWPLRRVLEVNGFIAASTSSNARLAEVLPSSAAAKNPRFNGTVGLSDNFDAAAWRLNVVGGRSSDPLTLEQIKAIPAIEYTTKFKCIEGWTQYLQAKGCRLSDFLERYGPTLPSGTTWSEKDLDKLPKWVGLRTPDGEYYVGIDMKSALHPQTILCWEEDGKPLPMGEGAPLRLVIPIKYGIKHLKRIGTLTLTDERPPDYWYEQGYDYFAGH